MAAAADEHLDLGSLLRPGARGEGSPSCQLCHSTRVTRIALELEDGSQVDFTNCLDCEHRVWRAHVAHLVQSRDTPRAK